MFEWASQHYVLSKRQRHLAVMLIVNQGGTSSDGLPFFVPLPIFFCETVYTAFHNFIPNYGFTAETQKARRENFFIEKLCGLPSVMSSGSNDSGSNDSGSKTQNFTVNIFYRALKFFLNWKHYAI